METQALGWRRIPRRTDNGKHVAHNDGKLHTEATVGPQATGNEQRLRRHRQQEAADLRSGNGNDEHHAQDDHKSHTGDAASMCLLCGQQTGSVYILGSDSAMHYDQHENICGTDNASST